MSTVLNADSCARIMARAADDSCDVRPGGWVGGRNAKAWQSAETRVSLPLSVVARPPREEGDPGIRDALIVDDRDEASTEESSTDLGRSRGGRGGDVAGRRVLVRRLRASQFECTRGFE